MSDLYLILHKVRGEPAFDIASRIRRDDGSFWWIIPTSGHRAYPLVWWMLEDLADVSDIDADGFHERPITKDHTVFPEDFPDHYQHDYTPQREARLNAKLTPHGIQFSIDDL